MKYIISILIFAFGFGLPVFGQKPQKDTINFMDSLGRKQGKWKKLYPTGQVGYVGTFKDNVPVGLFTYFYDDGSIKSTTVFSNKGKTARSKFYYPRGQGGLWAEGKYSGGEIKDSVWKYYNESGALVLEETYVKGKKNGSVKKYYENGKVLEEKNYRNDIEDGPWKQYFNNGQLKINGKYLNGFLEGKIQFFEPDGRVYATGAYQHAVKHGEWVFYSGDGTIKQKQLWKLGKYQGDENDLMVTPAEQEKEHQQYEKEQDRTKNKPGDDFDRQIPR